MLHSDNGVWTGFRHLRRRPPKQFLVKVGLLFLLTFGVVLPLLCGDLVYSPYFRKSKQESLENLNTLDRNRLRSAHEYLRRRTARDMLSFHSDLIRQSAVLPLDVLVIVETVSRLNSSDDVSLGYLTRVIADMDREILATPDVRAAIVMCNVDQMPEAYDEAIYMSQFVPAVEPRNWTWVMAPSRSPRRRAAVIRNINSTAVSRRTNVEISGGGRATGDRFRNSQFGPAGVFNTTRRHESRKSALNFLWKLSLENRLKKEWHDYAFCLRTASRLSAGWNGSRVHYVLHLQDDAVPKPGMLRAALKIVETRLEKNLVRGEELDPTLSWLALKLYLPEQWTGYMFDLDVMSEVVGLAFLGGGISAALAAVIPKKRNWNADDNARRLHVFVVGATYAILVALGIGRQNMVQLRRIHWSFISVINSPWCCMPATLYNGPQLPRLVAHLNKPPLVNYLKNPVDYRIHVYADMRDLVFPRTEPSLFWHIGSKSTLTHNWDPSLFLLG